MRVVSGNEAPHRDVLGGAVAIGNFDGAHRGHQVLFEDARRQAANLGTKAGAIVFEPHPREYFAPDVAHFRLTPLPEKLRLLDLYGLDFAVVLTFNEALASLSPDEFITQQLVQRLGVGHVVVGYDFSFGKGRIGDAETLRQAGETHGFGVSVIGAQGSGYSHRTEIFSSSSIRAALADGDVAKAAGILGHWWRVTGVVEPGAKIGSTLGFPTANIILPTSVALKHGVYAVWVMVEGERIPGAAYFGKRPTVDDGPAALEVTLFAFNGNLYGKTLSVDFIDFVREDQAFDDLDSMKVQIGKDCERVRSILDQVGDAPAL